MLKRLFARHLVRHRPIRAISPETFPAVFSVQWLEPRRLFAASYSLLEIGSSAVGLSDSGIVIGQQSHGAFANAMYYDGTMHELPSPAGPGVSSRALGVNNVGQVVGTFDNANGVATPYLFSSNILVDLTNRGVASVNAINDADLVTGTLGKPAKTLDGPAYFMGAGGGTFTRILSLRAHSPAEGLAINATGRIVGWSGLPSRTGANIPHAYDFFTHTDFGPGSDNAVNNNGDSAGYIVTNATANVTTAFVALSGSRIFIGTLGGSSSKALGINDQDAVVGSSDVAGGGGTHAFIYQGGNIVDLNSLIDPSLHVTLTDASAINASGQIAGTLTDAAGVQHGYLLTPISSGNQGTLTPVIKTSTLPTIITTGKPAHGMVTVSVTNSTGAVEKGRARVTLYLASGTAVDATSIALRSISPRLNLKPRATASFTISIANIPPRVAAGNYHLLAQSINAAGSASTVTAPLVISISAPHVSLSALINSVTPRTATRGGPAAATVILTNTGNISTTGVTDFDFGYTVDGSTEAVSLFKTSRSLHIAAQKTGKVFLDFTVPKTLTPGTYTPFVSITSSGFTTTAIASKTWTIA